MATQTTYTDPSGNKKTGYIEGGVTYTDSSLSTRVPTGSVVQTAGGTYYKGTENGVKINQSTGGGDSYTLQDGNSYTTYYDDGGSAYMDQELTTKIPFGTTNTKNGSQYYNDETLGNVPTASGAINDYYNNYDDMKDYLQQATDARITANDIATQQRIDELKYYEQKINDAHAQADRESYNAYIQAINPYGANAQQIARLGLSNSGYSESMMTSLGNTYQQALAGNEQAKIEALSELSRLADQARAEGDRQSYNVYADMYQSIYNAGVQKMNTGAQFSMQAATMLNNNKAREEEYAREDARTHLETDAQNAQTRTQTANLIAKVLLSGEMSVSQIASILNVSTSDIYALLKELY